MSIEILKHYIITSLFFFIGTTLNQVSVENSGSDRFEIWLYKTKPKFKSLDKLSNLYSIVPVQNYDAIWGKKNDIRT